MKTDKTMAELLSLCSNNSLETLQAWFKKPDLPVKLRVAILTCTKAMSGDRECIRILWERLEGRVPPAKSVPVESAADVGAEWWKDHARVYGEAENEDSS